jgi:hypothetical protein
MYILGGLESYILMNGHISFDLRSGELMERAAGLASLHPKGDGNFVFSRITSKRTTQTLNSRDQEYGMYIQVVA